MSYEKTNWQVGDTITATKLNKIEDQVAANEEAISSAGGDDSVFIVNVVAEDNNVTVTATADKTRQEMSAAVDAGKLIIIRLTYNLSDAQSIHQAIHQLTTNNIWTSTNASGYNFTAEKILGIDNTLKNIHTAKVEIGFYNNTDTITVSLPTYSFT